MGRHGCGSRSGGSSSFGGRSGGGSRGGGSRDSGSGVRTAKAPFVGCYNRSYYDSHGRFHSYYTSERDFGVKKTWGKQFVFRLLPYILLLVIMIYVFLENYASVGGKVDGDPARIFIEDRVDLLTAKEELEVLALFGEVYEVSGMPITLYTDDFGWKKRYASLEEYSEQLYYGIGSDEDAMIILFTTDTTEDEFFVWAYDMYCGDDTVKCFSDAAFDKLLKDFHKGMANDNLAMALDHAWNLVMDDLAKLYVEWQEIPLNLIAIFCWCVPAFVFLCVDFLYNVAKGNEAYRYFQDNPDKLSMKPMTTIYSTCPNCGAANSGGRETCMYCGSFLKAREGDVHAD